MVRTLIAAIASTGVAAVAWAGSASAVPDLCEWTGNVAPLMAAADRKAEALDVARMVRREFGHRATATSMSPVELSLVAPADGITSARGLSDTAVEYRVVVRAPGRDDRSAILRLTFRGLCYRTATLEAVDVVTSLGLDRPRISAQRALVLAEEYRLALGDELPPDNPLIRMELMRATSAPPNFGKLRWFVAYRAASGAQQVLAVHMNGRVTVVIP